MVVDAVAVAVAADDVNGGDGPSGIFSTALESNSSLRPRISHSRKRTTRTWSAANGNCPGLNFCDDWLVLRFLLVENNLLNNAIIFIVDRDRFTAPFPLCCSSLLVASHFGHTAVQYLRYPKGVYVDGKSLQFNLFTIYHQ